MLSRKSTQLLSEMPWREPGFQPRGSGIWNIPTMLTVEERKMLCYLTRNAFQGTGAIVDLGCFLGGSTAFLAHGLRENKVAAGTVQSFDLFRLSRFERNQFFPRHQLAVPEDCRTREMFDRFIEPWADLVEVHEGNILDYRWCGDPVEILFVDLMKSAQLYDHVIQQFFSCLVPFQSILILQDYMFKNSGAWHVNLMERLWHKFELIGATEFNSVMFLCVDEITASDIEGCKWDNISATGKIVNLARNAARWDSARRREIIYAILESHLERETEKGATYNRMARAS